jgi:hypothetical protein
MSTALIYQLALFIHILGAFGLVAAITLEASAQWGLRRASTAEEARVRLGGMRVIQRLAPASLGLILITGLYMMAVAWGPKGWILAAFAGLVVIGLVGGLVTGVRMARLGPAVGRAGGPLSDELRRMLRDRALVISLRTRAAIVLGILFLMTLKPSLVPSIVTLLAAAGIGLLASQFPSRRSRNEYSSEAG